MIGTNNSGANTSEQIAEGVKAIVEKLRAKLPNTKVLILAIFPRGPDKDEPAFATADMLYIHPDECIDCGACVPACPVDAIFALDETPRQWSRYIGKNREYYEQGLLGD